MLSFLTSSTVLTMTDGREKPDGDGAMSGDDTASDAFQDVFLSSAGQSGDAQGQTDTQRIGAADVPDGPHALISPAAKTHKTGDASGVLPSDPQFGLVSALGIQPTVEQGLAQNVRFDQALAGQSGTPEIAGANVPIDMGPLPAGAGNSIEPQPTANASEQSATGPQEAPSLSPVMNPRADGQSANTPVGATPTAGGSGGDQVAGEPADAALAAGRANVSPQLVFVADTQPTQAVSTDPASAVSQVVAAGAILPQGAAPGEVADASKTALPDTARSRPVPRPPEPAQGELGRSVAAAQNSQAVVDASARAAAVFAPATQMVNSPKMGEAPSVVKDRLVQAARENPGPTTAPNYDPRTAAATPPGATLMSGPLVPLGALGAGEALVGDGATTDIQRFEFQGLASAALKVDPGLMRPEIAASVSRQMVEVAAQAADKPVELTLNPEELGRVRLRVTTTDSGVSVSILAERSETLDLLRRHIDQLARDFREIGFSDASFSFARQEKGQGQAGGYDTPPQPAVLEGANGGSPTTDTVALHLTSAGQTGLDLRL